MKGNINPQQTIELLRKQQRNQRHKEKSNLLNMIQDHQSLLSKNRDQMGKNITNGPIRSQSFKLNS
jgi:hypothetical protein